MKKHSVFNSIKMPLLVTLLLTGYFLTLLFNTNKRHIAVNDDLKQNRAIIISQDCNVKLLSKIILNNGYADTEKDADFIADIIVERQKTNGRLTSLYSLQKRAVGQVPARIADSCNVLSYILEASCERLGQYDSLPEYDGNPLKAGDGKIIVQVTNEKTRQSKSDIPCAGVPVRLQTHFRDSLNRACSVDLGYIKTNDEGLAIFEGLDVSKSYSVLPIMKGYEYGQSKGTKNGKWTIDKKTGGMVFSFVQKEHRIPIFSNATLRQIKDERTMLVRSPQEYRNIMITWFILVIIAWWALILFFEYKKNTNVNSIISAVMFLTGLCVLMMFSMQDPLNDELNGVTMGYGVLFGLAVCFVFQKIDFVKLYQSKDGFDIPLNVFRWFFKPYKQKISRFSVILRSNANVLKKSGITLLLIITIPLLLLDILQITKLSKSINSLCDRLPKGIGWLLVSLLITALLWTPLGQSVGGMKVNLNILGIRFQPSEIAKYLIMFFMAAFFTRQANTIIAYSQTYGINNIKEKLKTLIWVIVGLIVLMGMYGILGDMGPALVVGITFVLLYSFIKSKVNLDKLDDETKWKRIFTCDFAMLVYGVITFAAFIVAGNIFGEITTLLFGLFWFIFWILFGALAFKKQLFESAILMNLVIYVFILTGNLGDISAFKNNSLIERFEARNSMCVNTWGKLDIEHNGAQAEPVSNTQVAHGLWSLASGGFYGQGMGNGKPSVTPAFHTDMILSSIGEQTGWLGLLLVAIAFYVLLRQMSIIGFNVGHQFAFYICSGFAIVTGVQFFIISLGSTGVIPLTGVTVPFLSYGRVSMILNLAAFGIILSLSNRITAENENTTNKAQSKQVEQYSYPIALVTVVFVGFLLTTLAVWQYYQVWKRNNTLIHPVYVINTMGAPTIEYNPRIALLTQNMFAGRIYDRKGVLLATSDRSEIVASDFVKYGLDNETVEKMTKRRLKRYYPFGEHLFFTLGDQNTGLMFTYDESNPVGYMAEVQHLSYLRGYDNIMYDKNGNPIKLRLKTDCLRESAYLTPKDTVSNPILLRNYRPLLKYLKDGIDGKKVQKNNEKVKRENYDLHLTIDAALQTELQNNIADYVNDNFKGDYYNLLRISVVVLDANNGDLIASANYPLPEYDRLRKESDNGYYSDNLKGRKWHAYTDRDLGTTFQTAPGSTAKIMSSMAGFRKLGTKASSVSFRITNNNAIEKSKKTGKPIEPTIDNTDSRYRRNPVTMKDAIVLSSNCYFVSLVNDMDLYDELKPVYSAAGIGIGGITPYYYMPKEDTLWRHKYYSKINKNKAIAINLYKLFKQGRLRNPKSDPDGKRRIKPMEQTNMSVKEWKWAWGQGFSIDETGESFDIAASPLNIARIAATIVNEGNMPTTQYVMGANKHEQKLRNVGNISLIGKNDAEILKEYMLAESKNQRLRNGVLLPSFVGGKTGTPERSRVERIEKTYDENKKDYVMKNILEDEGRSNDGWYMFFAEGDATHNSIAVVVRMERRVGSSAAVKLTKDVILESLDKNGYIKH